MLINLIVAMDIDGIIGNSKDNSIPWHSAIDFKHFKDITKGNPCLFGRKTYDSIPKKPLRNRLNIVLSQKEEKNVDLSKGYIVCNIKEAEDYYKYYDSIFICGGAEIYKYYLDNNMIDRVFLTKMNIKSIGDIKFPYNNFEGWLNDNSFFIESQESIFEPEINSTICFVNWVKSNNE